jgi:hypothetical protein
MVKRSISVGPRVRQTGCAGAPSPEHLQSVDEDGRDERRRTGEVDARFEMGEQQSDSSYCGERQQRHAAESQRHQERAMMVRRLEPENDQRDVHGQKREERRERRDPGKGC